MATAASSPARLALWPHEVPEFVRIGTAEADPGERAETLEEILAYGVAADRHACPNLVGQLRQATPGSLDMVLCTAFDADSGLRMNAALAARHGEAIGAGIGWLAATFQTRGVIAIEAFAAAPWYEPIRVATHATAVKIVELINDYPQTDPTLMLYTVADKRLRPGELPTSQRVLLLDAAAALAVGQALQGYRMTRVPLAIHDHVGDAAYFCRVPMGIPIQDVLTELEIDGEVLRCGDLLQDRIVTPAAPVGHGELTLHVTPRERPVNPEPCIRCGWCNQACPTRVQPALILESAQRGDPEIARRAGIHACVECGLCSHVCPSRLPLLATIRQLRGNTRVALRPGSGHASDAAK